MINEKLLETILNKIREKNQYNVSYINDIYNTEAYRLEKSIESAEKNAEELTTFIDDILSYMSEKDYDNLIYYLEE